MLYIQIKLIVMHIKRKQLSIKLIRDKITGSFFRAYRDVLFAPTECAYKRIGLGIT